MNSDDKNKLIYQFKYVTNVNDERARFYLEISNWKLDLALSHYFDCNENVEAQYQHNAVHIDSSFNHLNIDNNSTMEKSNDKSHFATLASIKKDQDQNESEEGQAFYAGGSERSGQQVLGPPKNVKDFVENFFKMAKEYETTDNVQESENPTFSGTGYRLADNTVFSQDENNISQTQSKDVILKMWKTGFTVDNSSLREYADPVNRKFLDSVKKGDIPTELLKQTQGGIINLSLEDHRNEDFIEHHDIKPFSGQGHLLGSPAPKVIENNLLKNTENFDNYESEAKNMFPLDLSKPYTSLQIRFYDGSKLIVKMNNNYTLGDLKTYIIIARPQFAEKSYSLMTTFPNKLLQDDAKTLEELGILNVTLQQMLN